MINVLYAGNYKVFDGLLLSAISLAQNTKSDDITIYVMTADLTEQNESYKPLSDQQIEVVQRAVAKSNPNNKVVKIDTKSEFEKYLSKSVNKNDFFTPYTLLRMLVTKIETIPDKIIYLDTDTIINNDINELFSIDISEYEAGVVRDIRLRNKTYDKDYFNAGVMLLNVKKLKETGAIDRAIEIYKTKKMFFVDQTALNKALTKKLILDNKFDEFRHKCKYYPQIVVHHMCNAHPKWHPFKRIKPWHREQFLKLFPMYQYIYDEYDKILSDK